MGTSEVAKNTVKAAEEGVNLIYKHYGNDLSKYFHGALKWLRNARKGSIPAAERLEVPKQISKVRLGNPKHDYAFFKDAKTGETILEISQTAQNPLRSGEKAASKQLLQELVGTKDDFGLRGLSYTEKELFPKKFLSAMTQENSAKYIYSEIPALVINEKVPAVFHKTVVSFNPLLDCIECPYNFTHQFYKYTLRG